MRVTSAPTWFSRMRKVPASTWFLWTGTIPEWTWVGLTGFPSTSIPYTTIPQIPNLSQVYAIALRPDLFLRIVHALRCQILFGVFDMNLLWGQIDPLFARASYLCVFFVFIPAIWIPEKTPRIRSRRGLPNLLQTSFRAWVSVEPWLCKRFP